MSNKILHYIAKPCGAKANTRSDEDTNEKQADRLARSLISPDVVMNALLQKCAARISIMSRAIGI